LKGECVTYSTVSDRETISLGRQLGQVLKVGDVIGLTGELGSGKTWFTKGLALGLGVSPDTIITSPSFSLINEYDGACTFFHIDPYRLESLDDFLSTGLDEYFYRDGVVAMEWADRWSEILPVWSLNVGFTIIDSHTRKITMSGGHPRAAKILRDMVDVKRGNGENGKCQKNR
jgi:tRNA threonylcarbamoyladenosine biosynthesis protein TsaE